MKQRLITSIGLIAIILIVGLINSPYLTGLLIAAIAIGGMWEAQKLFDVDDKNVFYFLSIMAVLAIFSNPLFIAVVSVLVVGGYIAYYQKDLALISLAFYPLVSLLLLLDLYHKTSMGTLGWLIVTVAATDSFAYLIGKNFARKFFKQGFCATSPNKSWEGVIGGIVVGTILGSIAGLAFFEFFESFFISLLVSVAGVFGDLFESFLKRRAGVKDSGNLLPGHGGVLDRIDAYLFSAPLLWALVTLN